MEEQAFVLLGSNRKKSDTLAFVEKALEGIEYPLADLLDHSITAYRYEHDYPAGDTFSQLMADMLRHPVWILATPVYWYSMSGGMKTFFDRLTDLLTIHKPLGRQLRGKQLYLLAVGADPALPPGFSVPFEKTCSYLGMAFKGCLYHSTKSPSPQEEQDIAIRAFRDQLQKALSSRA